MKPFGPEILVVTSDLRPLMRQDQSHAPSPHQIGISQVLQHLDDGPLVGAFRCAELSGREATDRLGDRGGRLTQHGQRMVVAEKIQYLSLIHISEPTRLLSI